MYIEPDDPLQFTGKIYQTDMASHLKNLMASDTCSKIEAALWRYECKKLQETSGLRAVELCRTLWFHYQVASHHVNAPLR